MKNQKQFENILLIQAIIVMIAIIIFCLFAPVTKAQDTDTDDYLCKTKPTYDLCGYEK